MKKSLFHVFINCITLFYLFELWKNI